MKTAYAYARFSSDNQREESISAQLRAIHEYCDTQDIIILQEFKDEAFSARTDKRPEFQRMFGIIKERPVDYLIVHKLDRFARNRADAAFYRGKLKEAGMRLVSVLERLDDSPESIIMEGLLDSMNEYYSANLARETKKGIRENILNGKRCGGRAPYGYSVENQHLKPNGEAGKVKQIFELYAEGKKLSYIAKEVNPSISHIEQILENPVYLGHLVNGEYVKENVHEPIISQELWDACQRRKNDHRRNAAGRAKVDYLLSGMLVCKDCGRNMVGVRGKEGYNYYWCRTKGHKMFRQRELEIRVISQLQKAFVPTSELKARFFDLVSDRVNSNRNIEEAKLRRSALSKRINSLLEAIPLAEAWEDKTKLMDMVNDLRKQMPPIPKPREISKAACDSFIDSFCRIDLMDKEAQKILLRQFVEGIVVNKDETCLYMKVNKGLMVLVNNKDIKIAPSGYSPFQNIPQRG